MKTEVNPYALVLFVAFLYLTNWAIEGGNALAGLGLGALLCLVLWPIAGEMIRNWTKSFRWRQVRLKPDTPADDR